METKDICIIKRDGKRENFSSAKIYNAITKAFVASDLTDCENLIDEITQGDQSFQYTYYRCGRNTGPCRNGTDESTAGSGKKVYHLQTVEKH